MYRDGKEDSADAEAIAVVELRYRAERLRRRFLLPVLIGAAACGLITSIAVGVIGIVPFLLFALPLGVPGGLAYGLLRRRMRNAWLREFSDKPGLTQSALAPHASVSSERHRGVGWPATSHPG